MAVLIPRHVHQIWFGPEPMRDELKAYMASWALEGYELHLWTEENLPDDLILRPLYERIGRDFPVNVGGGRPELGTWVQRADIVSYELVWRYGGIYANTDMELLRSLDPILDGVEAFAGFEQGEAIGNALMGAVPHHPLFKAIVDDLPERWEVMAAQLDNPMSVVTGPWCLTEHVRRGGWSGSGKFTVFPQQFFYPYLYNEMDREDDQHPDAYTSHHWGHTRCTSQSHAG